jgi:NADPH-dependent 2,4-dienoyl-CoA reductase/sulfur reductase-like enzyme
VEFRLGRNVERFEGSDHVEAIVLDNGDRLDCDLVVVGIGVVPATENIECVERDRDGGIVVDSRMVAAEGLYAAGDIAAFPDPRTGERIRIEHWRTAMQLGRIAGYNLAGITREFDGVPFFWTQQFDATLRYVGHARKWDQIIYRGDVEKGAFLAYYVQDGHVRAAAAMDRDHDVALAAEMIRSKHLPTLDDMPT